MDLILLTGLVDDRRASEELSTRIAELEGEAMGTFYPRRWLRGIYQNTGESFRHKMKPDPN